LDEIAMHADDPQETVQDLVTGGLLGERGLGRPVIGSAASIAGLSRPAIVRHWRDHYHPGAIVVAAAGAVDHDDLVEQLTELVPASKPPDGPGNSAGHDGLSAVEGGLVTAVRPLEQCSVALALPGTSLFDDRRYPLALLATVLGGGMASRLFVEVRERRGLTYSIDAGEQEFTDAGLVSVDWQCSPDKLVEITRLVADTCRDLAEHGVTEAELRRAQGQMRGQTVLAYEGANARMTRLGRNTLLGDPRTLEEVLAAFDAVTPGDVQREAARLFAGPAVLAVVGPKLAGRTTRALRRLVRL